MSRRLPPVSDQRVNKKKKKKKMNREGSFPENSETTRPKFHSEQENIEHGTFRGGTVKVWAEGCRGWKWQAGGAEEERRDLQTVMKEFSRGGAPRRGAAKGQEDHKMFAHDPPRDSSPRGEASHSSCSTALTRASLTFPFNPRKPSQRHNESDCGRGLNLKGRR